MTDEMLASFAGTYGTPAYIFDVAAMKERVLLIRKLWGKDVRLCYSVKANPFVIPAMLEVVDMLEVCSPGELDICRTLGIGAGRLVYSGISKGAGDIARAVDFGCMVYTAESVRQLCLLNAEGARRGLVLPVLLRLNAGSQFGMSEADLRNVLEQHETYANVNIEGLHYFAGTQRWKTVMQAEELEMLRKLYSSLRMEYGIPLPRLEYGPGLPCPYFDSDDFSDTLRPARNVAPVIVQTADWVELTVEMGRFFTAPGGYYLTQVVDTKEDRGIAYAVLDGGMHHVSYYGQVMGMKLPVIRHLRMRGMPGNEEKRRTWTLCGSLCTVADVLVRRMEFNHLELDDVLAFCNTGAYSVTEGMGLFLSRALPRVILHDGNGGGSVLVRDVTETSVLNTPKEYEKE